MDGANDTLLVYNYGLGNTADEKCIRAKIIVIESNLEIIPFLSIEKLAYGLCLFSLIYGIKNDTFFLERVGGLHDLRKRLYAWSAPSGPEVKYDDFLAPVLGKVELAPIQHGQHQVGRLLANKVLGIGFAIP